MTPERGCRGHGGGRAEGTQHGLGTAWAPAQASGGALRPSPLSRSRCPFICHCDLNDSLLCVPTDEVSPAAEVCYCRGSVPAAEDRSGIWAEEEPRVRPGQATGRTVENPASPVRTGPGPTASSLPQSTGPQVMVPSFPGRETGRRAATPTVTRDRKNPDVPKPPREPPHLPRAHPLVPHYPKHPVYRQGLPRLGKTLRGTLGMEATSRTADPCLSTPALHPGTQKQVL